MFSILTTGAAVLGCSILGLILLGGSAVIVSQLFAPQEAEQ